MNVSENEIYLCICNKYKLGGNANLTSPYCFRAEFFYLGGDLNVVKACDKSKQNNYKIKERIFVNLKKMILTSIFLAIGLILHQAMPSILFGMKPDLMLCMMFIVLYLNRKDYKMALLIGIIAGLFSAFTTTFPFGQIPNIVDKIITANIIFLLFKVMDSKVKEQIQIIIASIIGTFVSGIVFLSTALFLAGLPGPFSALVIGVVLPAVLLNTLMCVFLYNIVKVSLKRSSIA